MRARLIQVTQRRGVRLSTATAFLKPAAQRPNLRVLTNAQVKGVRLDGKRAVGIEFWQGETLTSADARREVIVAAGAIGSPQILQLSGVGPAALLRQHGIEVRHELAGGSARTCRTTANRASFFACATPRRSMKSRTAIYGAPS